MLLAAKSTFGSFGSIFASSKTITFTVCLGFSTKRSFGSSTINFTTIERNSHDRNEYIIYKYFSCKGKEKTRKNKKKQNNSKPILNKSFVMYLQENHLVSSYLRKESKPLGFARFPKDISPILQK